MRHLSAADDPRGLPVSMETEGNLALTIGGVSYQISVTAIAEGGTRGEWRCGHCGNEGSVRRWSRESALQAVIQIANAHQVRRHTARA